MVRDEWLRTIIIPRHPERGAEVAALVGGTRRSLGEVPGPLHIADTLGELGLFYRLADVALVGGSLVPHGGQNPMEPARLGCPILLGPHTGNFQERVLDLREAGAVRVVEPADAAMLAAAVHDVLSNPYEAQRMAEAAREVAQEATGTADRLADEIVTWLRPTEPSPEEGEVGTPESEREHQTP
jgi:3-deoxy-D-manno-octulosonic-acid transferase